MCVYVCLCVYVKENKSSTLPDAVFFSGTEFWVLLFSCWLTCRIFSFDLVVSMTRVMDTTKYSKVN